MGVKVEKNGVLTPPVIRRGTGAVLWEDGRESCWPRGGGISGGAPQPAAGGGRPGGSIAPRPAAR